MGTKAWQQDDDVLNVQRLIAWRRILNKKTPGTPAVLQAAAEGEWNAPPRICTYCGCVYTQNGREKVIRGFYDSMLGVGWKVTKP